MARRYADLQEELRVLTYNPITINTSTQRRKRRRGAQAATTAVEHSNEAEEGGQAVAIPLENEDTTRREFDARPGNLVVMDNTADNPDAYREEGLLGDWENKYLVAYVRYRYDVHDLDGLPEDHAEVDELDVTMCEPWLSTPHGKPDIPLTFAIAAARQSRDPEPDSSWDAAKKMKWLPITTMPLSLFSLRFPNVRRTARQCQHDFRGTKLTAVTSMKGVSEIKDSRHKNLVVRRPLAKLRYTMQLHEEANRECGASLPLDGIRHMEITYELARLRAALNVHKLDVDNKRRWFNDHRFNADEKNVPAAKVMHWHSDCPPQSNPQPKQPSVSHAAICDSLSQMEIHAGMAALVAFMGVDGESSASMAAMKFDDNPAPGNGVYEYHPQTFTAGAAAAHRFVGLLGHFVDLGANFCMEHSR
eukprot:jgi/Tetstr1/460118/TSEL_005434.t1